MSEPLIQLKGIERRYQSGEHEVTVLHPLDLAIAAGEMVAIVGASGSGKSTLLSLLAGLDVPSTGAVTLDGERLSAMDEDGRARVRGEKHHAGTYGPILKQLNNLKVQHLTMEFTAAGADDLESLGCLREDFELGLGVVDVAPGAPEAAALIASRVERALTRIDKKRITLNPDCGFAPGSAAKVDTDEVYLKLKAEAEAAQILRAKYA